MRTVAFFSCQVLPACKYTFKYQPHNVERFSSGQNYLSPASCKGAQPYYTSMPGAIFIKLRKNFGTELQQNQRT